MRSDSGIRGLDIVFVGIAALLVLAGLGMLITSLPTRSFSSIDVVGDITVGGTVDGVDLSGTNTRSISTDSDAFGRPNTNPPAVVNQDNIQLLSFTVNTDRAYYKFPIPADYVSGDMIFNVLWTNDGGTDDNGLAVKWELNYQVGAEGDPVSGNHVNSPKTVEDTYVGSTGWLEHHSGALTIASADFSGKNCFFLRLRAITPVGTPLTSEPHLIGMCFTYTAYNVVI